MKTRFASLGLVAVFAVGCGDGSRQVVGTDEHGNALTARVVVRDSSGAPAVGVAVEFRPADWLDGEPLDTASESSRSLVRCITDGDGSCSIPASGGKPLSIRAGDGEIAASATFGDQTESVIRMVLRPTGSVQGRLLGMGGGLVVRVPGLPGKTWTDESGRFSLGSLPEGLRRMAFGEAALLVLDSLPVRPRRALDFEIVLPDTTMVRRFVLDTFAVHALPRTPEFSPPGGFYDSALALTFFGVEPGDDVETSVDGIHWEVLNGSIRLMASACIKARSVRDNRILSNIAQACYVLGS